MWYYYDIEKLEENRLKCFSEEMEQTFENLFKGADKKKFIEKNLIKNLKECPDFFRYLNLIFDKYTSMKELEKMFFQKVYYNNINIEDITNLKNIPITYDEINFECGEDIELLLKKFYKYLYNSLKKTDAFKSGYVCLKKYSENLKSHQIVKQICPFCGINQLARIGDKHNDAYEHYLDKGSYPFVSLHYKNLFPICDTCNENYKGTKSIGGRKSFYPSSVDDGENILKIKEIILESNVDLEIKNEFENLEKIETWNYLFGIKVKSENIIKSNSSGWFTELKEDVLFNNRSMEEILENKLENIEKRRYECLNIFKQAYYKYIYIEELEMLDEIKSEEAKFLNDL